MLDLSSITPTKRNILIQYISMTHFSYMAWCISCYFQGELTCSSLKTICFCTAIVYVSSVASSIFFFSPVPPPVLTNFVVFPPGCGYSVARLLRLRRP